MDYHYLGKPIGDYNLDPPSEPDWTHIHDAARRYTTEHAHEIIHSLRVLQDEHCEEWGEDTGYARSDYENDGINTACAALIEAYGDCKCGECRFARGERAIPEGETR